MEQTVRKGLACAVTPHSGAPPAVTGEDRTSNNYTDYTEY